MRISRRRLPGLRRAVPSAPLDERYSIVAYTLRDAMLAAQHLPPSGRPTRSPRRCAVPPGAVYAPVVRVRCEDGGVNATAVACQPLYLVLGDEELLVQRAVQAVVDTARRADPDTEVRRLRVTDLAPGELAELVSPSLFADGRVIVLEAAHEAGKDTAEAVLGYVHAPADGIVLVVEHAGGNRGKALAEGLRAAGAVVTECPRLTRFEDRAAFVRDEVRRAGSRISADAATVLLDAVGSDLREL